MRDIKFRGKSLVNGKWLVGLICRCNVDVLIMTEQMIPYSIAVDPATVGQYIGLKDRNGKEIYEGDILDFYDDECGNPNNLCGSRLEVLWLSEECRFGYKNRVPDYEYCSGINGLWRENHYVVIGNIHDNPELLK